MEKTKKGDNLVDELTIKNLRKGGPLYAISDRLNSLPGLRGKLREAWKTVEVIILLLKDLQPEGDTPFITGSRPEFAIKYFNRLAKGYRVSLAVHGYKIPENGISTIIPAIEKKTPMQYALWDLWQFVFGNKGWERLKICPQCGVWFVDSSKNKEKERCSKECTNKWWSYKRRKEANHNLRK
jgi:hypothetical protein